MDLPGRSRKPQDRLEILIALGVEGGIESADLLARVVAGSRKDWRDFILSLRALESHGEVAVLCKKEYVVCKHPAAISPHIGARQPLLFCLPGSQVWRHMNAYASPNCQRSRKRSCHIGTTTSRCHRPAAVWPKSCVLRRLTCPMWEPRIQNGVSGSPETRTRKGKPTAALPGGMLVRSYHGSAIVA